MNCKFFLLWFGMEGEFKMENALNHVILSNTLKVDVLKESFISRKLHYTPATFILSDNGKNFTKPQEIGSKYHSCNST